MDKTCSKWLIVNLGVFNITSWPKCHTDIVIEEKKISLLNISIQMKREKIASLNIVEAVHEKHVGNWPLHTLFDFTYPVNYLSIEQILMDMPGPISY